MQFSHRYEELTLGRESKASEPGLPKPNSEPPPGVLDS